MKKNVRQKPCFKCISFFDISKTPAITAAEGNMIRSITLLLLSSLALLSGARGAESTGRFTGAQSCSTSGCHGGGEGHNQFHMWSKKDVHTRAHAILASGRSAGIGEKLGIKDVPKSARCTVCHSPLQSVSADLYVDNVKREVGVACETCHGPAGSAAEPQGASGTDRP